MNRVKASITESAEGEMMAAVKSMVYGGFVLSDRNDASGHYQTMLDTIVDKRNGPSQA